MQTKNESRSEEKRKTKRTLVNEAFSFFIAIPKQLGMSRVYMKDISTGGLSFWSEGMPGFEKGIELEIRLYTGPLLYLPVNVRIVRVSNSDIAVEFLDKESKSVKALASYLQFLDLAADAAVIQSQTPSF